MQDGKVGHSIFTRENLDNGNYIDKVDNNQMDSLSALERLAEDFDDDSVQNTSIEVSRYSHHSRHVIDGEEGLLDPIEDISDTEEYSFLNITRDSRNESLNISSETISTSKLSPVKNSPVSVNRITSSPTRHTNSSPTRTNIEEQKNALRDKIKGMLLDDKDSNQSPQSLERKNVQILEMILKDMQSRPAPTKSNSSPNTSKASESEDSGRDSSTEYVVKRTVKSTKTTRVQQEATDQILDAMSKQVSAFGNFKIQDHNDIIQREREQQLKAEQSSRRKSTDSLEDRKKKRERVLREVEELGHPIQKREERRSMLEEEARRAREKEKRELARLEELEREVKKREDRTFSNHSWILQEEQRSRREYELKRRIQDEQEQIQRQLEHEEEIRRKKQERIDETRRQLEEKERKHREELQRIERERVEKLKRTRDESQRREHRQQHGSDSDHPKSQEGLSSKVTSRSRHVEEKTMETRARESPSRSLQKEDKPEPIRVINPDNKLSSSPQRVQNVNNSLESEFENLRQAMEQSKSAIQESTRPLEDLFPDRSILNSSENTSISSMKEDKDSYYDRKKVLEMSTLSERDNLKQCLENCSVAIMDCKKITSMLEKRIETLRRSKRDLNNAIVNLEQDASKSFYDKSLVRDEIDYQNDELMIVCNRVQAMAEELEELQLMKVSQQQQQQQ